MSHPILILGANGRVGRKLVEYAAQSGFQVTALVRDASRFEPGHLVKQVVEGDATDPAVLDRILPGQRAVLAAIGTRARVRHRDHAALVTVRITRELILETITGAATA